jgi:hypothetical protein
VVKFPELVPHEYLELKVDPLTKQNVPVTKVWARGLERAGLLNLFDIPHFGHNNKVNACVKLLLSCMHGGYMWMDRPISIDMDLIARIIGLPT